MRKYQFTLDKEDGEHINWSRYIFWVDSEGDNRLIGRVSWGSSFSGNIYFIEYFKDCLEESKDLFGFDRISGCDYTNGKLVWKYKNRVPIFIEEKMVSPKRSDLPEILEKLGMKYYDVCEFIDKTNGVCLTDRNFIYPKEDASEFYNVYLHDISLRGMRNRNQQ